MLVVIAFDKARDDGEEVVLELAGIVIGGGGGGAPVTLTENHELAAAFLNEVLHELKGKAAQSVARGNHKLGDSSCDRLVQNSEETGALPVEPARNVCDNLVRRELRLECRDLPLEVVFLFGRRDSRVAVALPGFLGDLPSSERGWYPLNTRAMSSLL